MGPITVIGILLLVIIIAISIKLFWDAYFMSTNDAWAIGGGTKMLTGNIPPKRVGFITTPSIESVTV